jgi:hypothetical protein
MVRHIRAPKIVSTALCAALAFAVAPYGAAYADNDKKDDIDRSVVQQGFDSSPIPKEQLNLKGKDPYLVGLGSYLTFAGDCVGCHSFPRFLFKGGTPQNASGEGSNPLYGDPFSPGATPQTVDGQLKANFNVKHYLAGGRCFGPIQARNLTPDDSGLPRGMTEAEFIRAMRTGEDVTCVTKPTPPTYNGVPDGVCALNLPSRGKPPGPSAYDPNKLQTMPWVTYHNLTDKDLKAIYAYLSAIPKATACNTALNGCPGFKNPITGITPTTLAYTNKDECPNPPPPQ